MGYAWMQTERDRRAADGFMRSALGADRVVHETFDAGWELGVVAYVDGAKFMVRIPTTGGQDEDGEGYPTLRDYETAIARIRMLFDVRRVRGRLERA